MPIDRGRGITLISKSHHRPQFPPVSAVSVVLPKYEFEAWFLATAMDLDEVRACPLFDKCCREIDGLLDALR